MLALLTQFLTASAATITVALVKDINTNASSSNPSSLTNVNGALFFAADDGIHGTELWKSDSTASSINMVKDIYPQPTVSSNPDTLTNLPGIQIGSPPPPPPSYGSYPFSLTNVNGILFFNATTSANGSELWKSDGTADGTTMVMDINSVAGVGSSPQKLTNMNGTLFFTTDDGIHGRELWKSDGTASGTMMVADIATRTVGVGSSPDKLTNVNGTLFFIADDGIHGSELWKTDGTTAGTQLVKDINTLAVVDPYYYSPPHGLTNVNGTLFFIADDDTHGRELWKSDGTTAGTQLVKDINPTTVIEPYSYTPPSGLTNMNGTLFFTTDDGINGRELWKSDGTASGTTMVTDIYPGGSSDPENLTNVNGMLFFITSTYRGQELWKSDGTASGTAFVKNINSGGGGGFGYGSTITSLINVNGTLFFVANDNGSHGSELWKSDGTADGTAMVMDINPLGQDSSDPHDLTSVNGRLFFTANDGTHGRELWQGLVIARPIITSNGQPIAADDTTPSVSEGTDFGGTQPGHSVTHTFTITSSATPRITISEPAAGDFMISQSPSILDEQKVVITITFRPTAFGLRSATIGLASESYEPNPFTFAIQGMGEPFHAFLPLILHENTSK